MSDLQLRLLFLVLGIILALVSAWGWILLTKAERASATDDKKELPLMMAGIGFLGGGICFGIAAGYISVDSAWVGNLGF